MFVKHDKTNLPWLLLKPKNFTYLVSGFAAGSMLLIFLIIGVWLANSKESQNLQSQAINTSFNCSQIDKIPNSECQTLFQLYEKTKGESWFFDTNETRWFTTTDPCSWTGISCNGSQRVITINLQSRNLQGNLPINVWGSLAFLKTLDFSANKSLSGILPEDMKYLILDSFKTKETSVCLPTQLDDWYLAIQSSDEIFDCDGYLSSLKTCNQDCQSNGECENNLLCYTIGDDQKCRLADNPQDDQCRSADNGLEFACNHYCADSSECAEDLTCWYNRCREPENVESLSCTPSSDKLKTIMAQNCNQVCNANDDCAINMRCYQGSCRLATHPNNSNCQPVAPIKATQTNIIQKVIVIEPTQTTKGGSITSDNKTPTASQPTEASKTPTIAQETTVSAQLSPTSTVIPTPTSDTKGTGSAGWQNQLTEKFAALIKQLSGANANLSQTEKATNTKVGLSLLGGGVVLIILAKLLGKTRKPSMPNYPSATTPPPSSMINKLKQKNITLPKV